MTTVSRSNFELFCISFIINWRKPENRSFQDNNNELEKKRLAFTRWAKPLWSSSKINWAYMNADLDLIQEKRIFIYNLYMAGVCLWKKWAWKVLVGWLVPSVQSCSLHDRLFIAGPSSFCSEHSFPFPWGWGSTHHLVRYCIPPPQSLVHSDHRPQLL